MYCKLVYEYMYNVFLLQILVFFIIGISFPMDLDVKCKATLLGATFLIVTLFYYDYWWHMLI